MTLTLKRQLTEDEKKRVLAVHGRKCFATGHTIPDSETVQFDHIHAFVEGGKSELDNIAPMCETHNKEKGTLPLADYRVKLRLREFFNAGDAQTLKDLLQYLQRHGDVKDFGRRVVVGRDGDHIILETPHARFTYTLYKAPTTGWKYFYATLPIELLDSDDEEDHKIGLQPRYLIFDKVFELYRHFQQHPVLQPSIGRLHNERLVMFDGQHKIAALLWAGQREFECKIYLDPDLQLLNETNIAAHDAFAQTRFFTSIMVSKLGSEFGADFERYKNLADGTIKSEAGFMKYLERERPTINRAQRMERFRDFLYNSILADPSNKMADLVSKGNRSTDEKPLTLDMLTKSIFSAFLYREPVEDSMATDAYKREQEINNVIALMNMLYELALGSWNPKAGPNDDFQRKLRRLSGSKSMMAWAELLRDTVRGKLELNDEEERARPLYRELSDSELDAIKRVMERLVGWKLWDSPPRSEIDTVLAGNKGSIKQWFKEHGLTTGYLGGAGE